MDLSRSTYLIVLSKGGNSLVFFAGITYLARVLHPDELGTYFLFMALVGLLSIPADFGLRGALEKRLSEGMHPETTLGSALAFKSATVTLVSVLVLAASPYLDRYLEADLAAWLILAVVATELSQFYIHAVRGELRVGETAPIELGQRVVWFALGAALATHGWGALGIVIGYITGSVVALVWAYGKCNTAVGRPSIDSLRSLLEFSKYNAITSIGARVYSYLDIAVIGFFLAQSFVSAYEVAWQVTLLVILVSKSIGLSIFPHISQWDANSETEQIESTLSTALGASLFFSIPALVGALVYAEEILRFIFRPEYTVAATVLVVLMVEKLFQSVNDIVEGAVRAIDRPDLAAKATVVAVGLNLVLNPVLVVSVGFVGAAIATTFAWFVNTALHTRYLARFVTVEFPVRLVGWYTLASLVMGGLLVPLKATVPVANVFLLVAQVAIGAAVYVCVSSVIPDVRKRIIIPGMRVIGF